MVKVLGEGGHRDKPTVKYWELNLRLPDKLKADISSKASVLYSGRGKVRQLVNESIERYWAQWVAEIDWSETETFEFLDVMNHIRRGREMPDLGSPKKLYISLENQKKIVAFDVEMKKVRPLEKDVVPGLLRYILDSFMYHDPDSELNFD